VASKKYGVRPPGWAKHKRNLDRPFWPKVRVQEPRLIEQELAAAAVDPCPSCAGRGCVRCGESCPDDEHVWGPSDLEAMKRCMLCGADRGA
jgi:hypothetical protein